MMTRSQTGVGAGRHLPDSRYCRHCGCKGPEAGRRCVQLPLGGMEKEQWWAELQRGDTSRASRGLGFELDSLFTRQPSASFKWGNHTISFTLRRSLWRLWRLLWMERGREILSGAGTAGLESGGVAKSGRRWAV